MISPTSPRDRWREFISVLVDLLHFMPGFVYFFMIWNQQELVRRWRTVGAFGFLSLSILILWAEVTAEFVGARRIADMLARAEAIKWWLLAAFTIAVVMILLHHRRERRHLKFEFIVGAQLFDYSNRRRAGGGSVNDSAETALSVAREFGGKRVIVWLGSASNIDPVLRRPGEGISSLPNAEEVYAELVQQTVTDGRTRYVPRVHLTGFESRKSGILWAVLFDLVNDRRGHYTFVRPKLDLLSLPSQSFGVIRSCIAIPLREPNNIEPIGVVTFEFDRTSSLGRDDFKTVVFFANLISQEVRFEATAPTA